MADPRPEGDRLGNAKESVCVPWRTLETERAGCREGMRLAAHQFLSQYRPALQDLSLNRLV